MATIENTITPDSTLEKTNKRISGFDINSTLHEATKNKFKLCNGEEKDNDTILHFTKDNFVTLNGRLYGTGGGFYYLNPLYEKMNNGTSISRSSDAERFMNNLAFNNKLAHVWYETTDPIKDGFIDTIRTSEKTALQTLTLGIDKYYRTLYKDNDSTVSNNGWNKDKTFNTYQYNPIDGKVVLQNNKTLYNTDKSLSTSILDDASFNITKIESRVGFYTTLHPESYNGIINENTLRYLHGKSDFPILNVDFIADQQGNKNITINETIPDSIRYNQIGIAYYNNANSDSTRFLFNVNNAYYKINETNFQKLPTQIKQKWLTQYGHPSNYITYINSRIYSYNGHLFTPNDDTIILKSNNIRIDSSDCIYVAKVNSYDPSSFYLSIDTQKKLATIDNNGFMDHKDKQFIDKLATDKKYSVIKDFCIKYVSNTPSIQLTYITNPNLTITLNPVTLHADLPLVNTLTPGLMDAYDYSILMTSIIPLTSTLLPLITTINDIPNVYSKLGHTHDDRYYTTNQIEAKLTGKSNEGHTHDDRYYTKTEINTKLNNIESKISYITNWLLKMNYVEPTTVPTQKPTISNTSNSIILKFNLLNSEDSPKVSIPNSNVSNSFNNVVVNSLVRIWDNNLNKFIYQGSTYTADNIIFDLTSYKYRYGFSGYAYVSTGFIILNTNGKGTLDYVLNNTNAEYMYDAYCVEKPIEANDKFNEISFTKMNDYDGQLNCLLGNVRMKGNGGTPYDLKSWNLCLASPLYKYSNGALPIQATSSDVSLNGTYLYQNIECINPVLQYVNNSTNNNYVTYTKCNIDVTDKLYYGMCTTKYKIDLPKNSGITSFAIEAYTYSTEKRVDTMFDLNSLNALIK